MGAVASARWVAE